MLYMQHVSALCLILNMINAMQLIIAISEILRGCSAKNSLKNESFI